MEESFVQATQFVVDEGTIDFWWPRLEAFKHYIPIDPDLEALIPCIDDLIRQDDIARNITLALNSAVRHLFSESSLAEYTRLALYSMASLLNRTNGTYNGSVLAEEWMKRRVPNFHLHR